MSNAEYNSEYERWEKRFAVPDYVFGTAPNAFLASQAAVLPKSGAALAVGIVKAAVACHNGMATFAEAGVAGKDEP